MQNRGRPRYEDILTPREWDVLALIREGLTNEEIAERLGIAHNTVKYHVSEILGKLEVRSRDEAASWRGRPRVAFGFAPVALWLQKAGTVSPLKLAGAGAIAVAGVALVLLALGVLMSNGSQSLGKIAFVRDGNIWVQELPDGTPYQLTHRGASVMPRWSPSGEWLLYSHRPADLIGPDFDIWAVRGDGSDERLVAGRVRIAYWLPGGTDRIVLVSEGGTTYEDADGANSVAILEPYDEDGERVYSFHLLPSPDGSRIAYQVTRYPVDTSIESYRGFWTSLPDGSDAREVAVAVDDENTASVFIGWSSDGSHVLYAALERTSGDPRQGARVYAAPASGDEPSSLGFLSWAPFLAYPPDLRSLVAGEAPETWTDKRIALIAPDASAYTYITDTDVAAIEPAWSPDGRQIAYISAPDLGREGRDEALALRRLWVMDADGGNQRQLTHGDGFRDAAPMWSTDGKHILFARVGVEDFCDTASYSLMLYGLDDALVSEVVPDLPLLGTDNLPWEDGQTGECLEPPRESAYTGSVRFSTDSLGHLALNIVLDWWQPGTR